MTTARVSGSYSVAPKVLAINAFCWQTYQNVAIDSPPKTQIEFCSALHVLPVMRSKCTLIMRLISTSIGAICVVGAKPSAQIARDI